MSSAYMLELFLPNDLANSEAYRKSLGDYLISLMEAQEYKVIESTLRYELVTDGLLVTPTEGYSILRVSVIVQEFDYDLDTDPDETFDLEISPSDGVPIGPAIGADGIAHHVEVLGGDHYCLPDCPAPANHNRP
jgi:hypothetical protein